MPRAPLGPPAGYYGLWDVDGAPKITYWRLDGRRLDPWPVNAKYGPAKLPFDPTLDPEVRRALNAAVRDAKADYLARVRDAITADPRGAARMFINHTGRCQTCKADLKVDDLQPDADGGGTRGAAERLVAAALRGSVDDLGPMLDGAEPADVIETLSAVIAALARTR
jgi:hypothetical protein